MLAAVSGLKERKEQRRLGKASFDKHASKCRVVLIRAIDKYSLKKV